MNIRLSVFRRFRNQAGFSLLEGLIAIALFSFGILGIIGVQGQSIKNAGESKYRTDASFLANQLVGQMWADRGNLKSYEDQNYAARVQWDDTIKSTLPAGVGVVGVNANRVTITVIWQSPGQSQHRYVAVADING